MLEKYKSFLIRESISELTLMLEGQVKYSTDFLQRLYNLTKKSPVASLLRDLYGNYYDDSKLVQNYIDITSKDDMVTFISQKKANDLESISQDPYLVKGRNEVKIGRLVRNICSLANKEFSDKEVEDFVNLYKSMNISGDEEFSMVSEVDIAYWYNQDLYYTGYGLGALANSCMRDVASSYFDIYSQNNCRLLILTMKDKKSDGEDSIGKLIGRAIIWEISNLSHLSTPCDAKYFMDRIYCMRDADNKKFQAYAENQGWLYKQYNNSDSEKGVLFNYKGGTVSCQISISLTDGECVNYPYLDTMKFLDFDKEVLSNIGFKGGYVLDATDGSCGHCDECKGEGIEICSHCDGEGEESCYECEGTGNVECSTCEGNGNVDCYRCEGTGTSQCPVCNGDCEEDCEECDGSGKIDGEECKDCIGTGKKECSKCDGEGEIECVRCGGECTTECGDCDGNGEESCGECGGDGKVDCSECGGVTGKLCPECTGIATFLSN